MSPTPVLLFQRQKLPKSADRIHSYDAFKCHWYLWQFCGFKFPKNRKWKIPYVVYAVILNLTVTLLFPLTLIINCFLSVSFSSLCENLYMTTADVNCNCKLLNVFIVRRKLLAVRHILDKLDVRASTEDEMEILRAGIRSAHKCFWSFFAMFVGAILSSQLVVYMAKERILMYPAWFPLDWKNSYRDFVIIHSYQLIGITVQGIQDLGNTTYPQAYLRILCAHIEALSLRISNLGKCQIESHERNYKELVECIRDHQIIIELRRDLALILHKIIQEIMSITCLFQFVFTGLCHCTIGVYMLYVGLDYSKLVNILVFFGIQTFEIFILCHFGDRLCQEGERLTAAIYSCNWVIQNRRFKLALILLLRRSQRPMVIMAGNFIPIRLPTFIQVMKTAYSTFVVLSEVK